MINPIYFEEVENPQILELVLFCIDRGINIHDSLQQQEERIVIADKYDQVVNDIVRNLYSQKKLVVDYSQENQRLKLAHPFWVTSKTLDHYENIRQYFKARYCGYPGLAGDPDSIKILIDQVIAQKGYTVEQIERAAKSYIDNCIKLGRWIKTLPNFINDSLSIFIEDNLNEESNDLSRFI